LADLWIKTDLSFVIPAFAGMTSRSRLFLSGIGGHDMRGLGFKGNAQNIYSNPE
jgi:hypothetical protein